MKKTLISCLFLYTLFVTSSTVSAAVYYPKSVSLAAENSTYDGGVLEVVQISLKDKEVQVRPEKMKYDIGVARELKSGNLVQYQIINTNTTNYASLQNNKFLYQVQIPNIFDQKNDTYVVYIKSYPEQNPDAEDFLVSKSFTIKATTKPTVLLEEATILTNTGEAFGLQVGPTLYKNAKKASNATSAELVLSLNANKITDVQGTLSFTKLRSNAFLYSQDVKFTALARGNVQTIALPTFDYAPGVYLGELHLTAADGVQLPEKIDFQYIIDGPIVTMGQVQFIENSGPITEFEIPVFGKPHDIYTNGDVTTSASSTPEVYSTTFTFYDKNGNVLGQLVTELDYNKTSRQKLLVENLDWKRVSKMHVGVVDAAGGVIYSTDQDVFVPLPKKDIVNLFYALIIICLGIAWYGLSRRKSILVWTVILALICAAGYAFASWTPTGADGEPINFGAGDDQIFLTFNQDFPNQPVSCSEDTDVFLKMVFLECQNRVRDAAAFGISRISMEDARAHSATMNYTIATSTCATQVSPQLIAFMLRRFHREYVCGAGGHDQFLYTTDFMKIASVRGPVAPNSKLYISIKGTKNLRTEYALPLATSNCDRCSNVEGEQLVRNFTKYGRDYFHSSADGKLYFAPSTALGASICNVDMCADTEVLENEIPDDKEWNLSATDEFTKYSCQQRENTACSCSGRDRTCTENGVTNTTTNAPQCALQAYCAVSKSNDQSSATFSFSVLNGLGAISYSSGAQTETVPLSVGETVTRSITATDAFDGQTSTASCSAANTGTTATSGNPTVGDPDNTCVPGIDRCPCILGDNCPGDPNGVQPKIVTFTGTKIVDRGRACEFVWSTQYFDSCTMNGQSVTASDRESVNTSNGNNVVRRLLCVYGGNGGSTPITEAKTVTCLVRPTVVEQ
ncbi:MAG: hypothetical protein RJB39_102 [Candidatus Parcubacteria bacterium]|jgi:hypothetical protein